MSKLFFKEIAFSIIKRNISNVSKYYQEYILFYGYINIWFNNLIQFLKEMIT